MEREVSCVRGSLSVGIADFSFCLEILRMTLCVLTISPFSVVCYYCSHVSLSVTKLSVVARW